MTKNSLQQEAETCIQNLRINLLKYNYSVTNVTFKNSYYEINVSDKKNVIKILTYFGIKGIRTILIGNKESKFYKELESKINEPMLTDNIEIDQPEKYIGSDESGKGDFFGPLVVCAFAYDSSIKNDLFNLNLRDSKLISDSKIIEIYQQLKNLFFDRFEIIEIHPPKYNELYNKMQNLNKILIWAHTKAISNLSNRFDYRNLIIDKFTTINSFENTFLNKRNLKLEEKAERYTAVAAASIIARARFLIWFEKMNYELGVKIPLGSSDLTTNFAKDLIKQKGKEFVNKLVKLHFKNFKKI